VQTIAGMENREKVRRKRKQACFTHLLVTLSQHGSLIEQTTLLTLESTK